MTMQNAVRPSRSALSFDSVEESDAACEPCSDNESSREFRNRIKDTKSAPRCWSTTEHRDAFWPSNHIEPEITPGLYKVVLVEGIGVVLKKITVSTDEIVMVDDMGPTHKVIEEILRFWSPEIKKKYAEHGFLHKRGILMHGDPGSGKTVAVQYLINEIIDRGGIALYSPDSGRLIEALQMVRNIQPDLPIIVVMEDFELLVSRHSDENQWLSLMDGEAQVDNVVYLATTNYAEKLDKRFIDRPSRFDLIVPVQMPSALTRAVYLSKKAPNLSLDEIKQWVKESEGFSVAHLKEMIISVCVLGNSLFDTTERLRSMRERDVCTEKLDNTAGFGFGGRNDPDGREVVKWDEFERNYME